MAYRFDRDVSVTRSVRRVACDGLDDAIERLSACGGASADEIEDHVHEVRKRCKELRGLLRLVRSDLGDDFRSADRTIRTAARELSALRDAHALLDTFDALEQVAGTNGELDGVRQAQASRSASASKSVSGGDPRLVHARLRLETVRRHVPEWKVTDGFATVERGLERTYRDARDAMRAARKRTTDEAMHEWRKHAKYQWYQVRLLEKTAPTILEPLAEQLAALADALGDDHDLSVLVEALEREPDAFGGAAQAHAAARLARHHQQDLRERSFRVGARLWAEAPAAYARRLRSYRRADRKLGRELDVGGLADLAADDRSGARRDTVERERKWLVRGAPADIGPGGRMRKGYLPTGAVAVRIREADGDDRTLTIKSGSGAVRTELEWPIDAAEFEAMWPLTGERRIEKVRPRIDVAGGRTAELDVFGGDLEGFDLVEVEFDDDASMAEFEPPDWFGLEVTDDERYGNASLALHGAPLDGPAAAASA